MQLNEAKFRVNGNCGYVLKPQQMCKGNVPLYIYYCKCQTFQKKTFSKNVILEKLLRRKKDK